MRKAVVGTSLNKVFWIQGLVTLTSAVLLIILSPQSVPPFLAGAGLITLNFYLLSLMWRRVFDKKPVAITGGLIITKYTVLGLLLFVFVKKWGFQMAPLLAGLTTMLGSFIILGLQTIISEKIK